MCSAHWVPIPIAEQCITASQNKEQLLSAVLRGCTSVLKNCCTKQRGMKLHLLRLMSRQAKMHMPYLPRYRSLILKQAASQTTGCDILNNLKQSLYSLPRSCYPQGDKVGHPQIKCTQHKSEYLPNCPSQLPNPQNLLAMRSSAAELQMPLQGAPLASSAAQPSAATLWTEAQS